MICFPFLFVSTPVRTVSESHSLGGRLSVACSVRSQDKREYERKLQLFTKLKGNWKDKYIPNKNLKSFNNWYFLYAPGKKEIYI